ncbi:MAG: hypothetical protein J0H83_15205 [Candidatus Melainabacteria bacterium]|nr:hypothetical protein [Candidatus Melainabacteria bacterium]
MSNKEATIDKNYAHHEKFTSNDNSNAAHVAAEVYSDKKSWQQLGKNDFNMPEGFEKSAPTIDFGPKHNKESNIAINIGSHQEINLDKAAGDRSGIDGNNSEGDKNRPTLDDKGPKSRSERGAFDEDSKKQIDDQTKRELTPVAKSIYDKEERSLSDYNRELRKWSMGTGGGPMPERPATPVHDAVKERAAAREKEIEKQAKDEYGPIGKSELKRQMRDHDEKIDKFYKSFNPAGTGDWRKAPEPPALVKEYYDKVKRIIASKN